MHEPADILPSPPVAAGRLARLRALAPRLLLAASSGLLWCLVSPPLNLHWLHWFIWVPVLLALKPGDHRRNAWIGYAQGWVGQFAVYFWLVDTIVTFSSVPWIAAFPIHLLFSTAFAIPWAVTFGSVQWLRERIGAGWVVVVPAVQVSMEWLFPALFPHYHGVVHYRTEWTWQLASVTGVPGLTYLAFLVNCAVAEAFYRRWEHRPAPLRLLCGVAAVYLANLGFGAWRFAKVEAILAAAPTVRVAIVQQSAGQAPYGSPQRRNAVRDWQRLTRQVAAENPDLVVWPEGALPTNPTREDAVKVLGDMCKAGGLTEKGFDFLVGGGTIERPDPTDLRKYVAYNSCYLFGRDGKIKGRYDKMVPLPFGEYMPFADTFPAIKEWVQGPGDFRAGTVATMFQADGYTFSTPICYEAILFKAMRALSGADLFVNITNDSWFGDTMSPHQHAMLSAAQATEWGRPMVRDAYTGVSFVVEPHGRILYETRPYEEVAAVHEVRMASIDTVYRHGGWAFPWVCIAGAGVAGLVARGRRPGAGGASGVTPAVPPT